MFHFTKKYLQAALPETEEGVQTKPSLSPFLSRRKSKGNVYIDITPHNANRDRKGSSEELPESTSQSSGTLVSSLTFIFAQYQNP